MKKCFIGTDIISVKRIENSLEKYGEMFLNKIFTDVEKEYCMSKKKPGLYVSGHFAAKESAAKALGTGFACGVTHKTIEINHEESGKPFLKFYNGAKKRFMSLGITGAEVSISHEKENAIASVILFKG